MWFSPGQPGPRKQMSLVRGRAAGNLDAKGAGLKGQTAPVLGPETVTTGPAPAEMRIRVLRMELPPRA